MHKATVRFYYNQTCSIHNTRPSLGSYDNLDIFHIAQATHTTAVFGNFAYCRKDCIETLKQAKNEIIEAQKNNAG
ncbi:hypothetical protein T4D_3397 [Trichinella pseudospiralis]|uniref:Uncharacterized protein n=1 Tax=Trichinella pseudospiralis TaxID=6337 RepID=A0A0V1F5L4_TRIPS|nr:hypothetical protein T4D_3397 [Trichinella pseudospiralis]